MAGLNRRDVVAGLVIVFLVGLLLGQRVPARRTAVAVGQVAAALNPAQAVGDIDDLRRSGNAFAGIAEAATPAVVNINSTRIRRGRAIEDPMFRWFFGDQTSQSLGSGVIVSADGVVVTNNHNIASSGADQVDVRVTLHNGKEYDAKVVGADPDSDVAVLKIKASDLPFVAWGDSNALRVGEWVLAIGSPYGFSQTVTAGIVSAKGRPLGLSEFEEFIQTDAAINPGNSGGALLDVDGKLVGINTAIFSQSGGYQGIGFAIPSEIVRANVEQILKSGKVVRGWIGVIAKPIAADVAQQLSLLNTDGAIIAQLYAGQPAMAAGLKELDVVTAVDDKPVKDPGQLRRVIALGKPKSEVRLKVVRDSRTIEIKCRLVDRPLRPDGQPEQGI
jgi:Do/DeqQ family serine protease